MTSFFSSGSNFSGFQVPLNHCFKKTQKTDLFFWFCTKLRQKNERTHIKRWILLVKIFSTGISSEPGLVFGWEPVSGTIWKLRMHWVEIWLPIVRLIVTMWTIVKKRQRKWEKMTISSIFGVLRSKKLLFLCIINAIFEIFSQFYQRNMFFW